MWNEQKGERLEDLRKRETELTDPERAELAALAQELEGLDFAYTTEATKRKIRDREKRSNQLGEGPTTGSLAWLRRNAGAVSIVAGAIAAIGTVLLGSGISPWHVSAREPGVDHLRNHFCCFGPFVLIGWTAILFIRSKGVFVMAALFWTFVYLCGFTAVR